MKNLSAIFLVLCLQALNMLPANAQNSSDNSTQPQLEEQYENYITTALRLQVKADSLSRTANQKRRELAFSGNDQQRREAERLIIGLEQESFMVQRRADSLYSQARAIELKLMAGKRHHSAGDQDISGVSGTLSAVFLKIGDTNVSTGLSSRDLLSAKELEPEFNRADSLVSQVSQINDEIETLSRILGTKPRRRERRNINRKIDELSEQSLEMNIEAMQIFEKINQLRYKAAKGFLEEKRSKISDQTVINSGTAHEEIAAGSFVQAAGLRQTAAELRSDKYLADFLSRAYSEEIRSFTELEKAIEIYNRPLPGKAETVQTLPLGSDGRIDPALALSRARAAGSVTTPSSGQQADPVRTGQSGGTIEPGFSIRRETPYSPVNPLPVNPQLPEGIIYSVQLGIFNTFMGPETFGGLFPVYAVQKEDNGQVTYFAGAVNSFAEAEKALIEVNRHGFRDAFIVAYNNRTRMPVNRARQMENNRFQAAAARETPVSAPVTAVSAVSEPGSVVFRIQLGAFRTPVQSDVYRRWQNLAANKTIEHILNNNGLYVYSIGNFNTFDEAAAMRDLFRKQAVRDAFIVPFSEGVRITFEEADRLLRRR